MSARLLSCREHSHRLGCAGGFTLLEVLVALVLLSLFALTSYKALDSVLMAERHATAEMARWRQMAMAFSRLKTDLANAVAGVESRHGLARGLQAGLESDGSPYLDLDRLLPEDQTGGIQRVGYRYRDGALRRRVWPESAPGSQPPAEVAVLEGLDSVSLSYMDQEGHWHPAWTARPGAGALPRAVEMQIRFVSGEPLRRMFLLQ